MPLKCQRYKFNFSVINHRLISDIVKVYVFKVSNSKFYFDIEYAINVLVSILIM